MSKDRMGKTLSLDKASDGTLSLSGELDQNLRDQLGPKAVASFEKALASGSKMNEPAFRAALSEAVNKDMANSMLGFASKSKSSAGMRMGVAANKSGESSVSVTDKEGKEVMRSSGKEIGDLQKTAGEMAAESAKGTKLEGKKPGEVTLKNPKGENTRHNEAMIQSINKHMADMTKTLADKAVKDAEKKGKPLDPTQAEADAKKRLEATKAYFTTIDPNKRAETPLQRVSAMFAGMQSSDEDKQALMETVIKDAFDQHLENPEQYVSHGFDHTLSVADHVKSVVEQNPEILDKTMEKYGVGKEEARFLLESVALFHDFGYPLVGDREKSVHGIAGADLVSSREMQDKILKAVKVPPEKQKQLMQDLRDAVLFHSADKVEQKFDAKIDTTRGSFLTDKGNIAEVVSNFYKDDAATPEEDSERVPTEIIMPFATTDKELNDIGLMLGQAREAVKGRTGGEPPFVNVRRATEKEEFKGRTADLQSKKDKKLGLEYSEVDLSKDSPLQGIIRLTDNMDMVPSRFSQTQQHPAFQAMLEHMGGNTPQTADFKAIETKMNDIDDKMKAIKDKKPGANPADMPALEAAMAPLKVQKAGWVKTTLAGVMKDAANNVSVGGKGQATPQDVEKLQKILNAQDSQSFRHFGGCLAVRGVKLIGSKLQVTVNKEKYDKLNQVKVKETVVDKAGKKSEANPGVGEYQVFRARQAFASLKNGGKPIEVEVLDEAGNKLE